MSGYRQQLLSSSRPLVAVRPISIPSVLTPHVVHAVVVRFGKHVDKVVPFLPLAKPQLRRILDLKLKEKSEARRSVQSSPLKPRALDSPFPGWVVR